MQYTQRFTENYEPGGGLFPANYAIGVHQTAWSNLSNHQRGVFLLYTGVLAAGATVDAQLWQATDNTGTGAQIIAGKAITQLTQAGGDLNDTVIVEFRTEELDVSNGYDHVSAIVTVAGNTAILAGGLLLGGTNNAPVPTVLWTEIVD